MCICCIQYEKGSASSRDRSVSIPTAVDEATHGRLLWTSVSPVMETHTSAALNPGATFEIGTQVGL